MPRGPVFNQFYGLRGRSLTTAIAVVTGLIFCAFGYGQADVGGLVVNPAFQRYFPGINYLDRMTGEIATEQGLVIGTWNAGCFVSALLTVFVGDKLGRKKCLVIGMSILIIGKLLQASSFSYAQYIVGRFVAGFGNGINASTAPAWQAETSKAHRRGRMLLITSGACLALGVAFAYWITFAMLWANPSEAAWRFPMAFQAVFIIPALLLIHKLPESPRWLILKGRQQEALEVLAALDDAHPTDDSVRAELLQVKDAILQMASGRSSQAFSMGEYRYLHRVLLAVLLQVLQQWTGINLFIQYLGSMFVNQAGVAGWPASVLAAGAGTAFFLVSFVSVVGIDRFWGRRTLTLFGSAGMTASMVALACAHSANGSQPGQIVTAVFIFVFISFFAIGWQGMAWLWAVELIPLPVRGPANALATSANWLSNFAVVVSVSPAFHYIGYRTYVLFAVINFVTIPIIYFLYPETGCRSLEEVDVLFHLASRTKNPWFSVRDIASAEPLWYGRNGKKSFAYEASEWHHRFARVSSDAPDYSSSPSASGMGATYYPGGEGGYQDLSPSEAGLAGHSPGSRGSPGEQEITNEKAF